MHCCFFSFFLFFSFVNVFILFNLTLETKIRCCPLINFSSNFNPHSFNCYFLGIFLFFFFLSNHPSTFHLPWIEFHDFFHVQCFRFNDPGHRFKRLIGVDIFFSSYFFFWYRCLTLFFFLKKIVLWLSSISFSIELSRSYDLGYGFVMLIQISSPLNIQITCLLCWLRLAHASCFFFSFIPYFVLPCLISQKKTTIYIYIYIYILYCCLCLLFFQYNLNKTNLFSQSRL